MSSNQNNLSIEEQLRRAQEALAVANRQLSEERSSRQREREQMHRDLEDEREHREAVAYQRAADERRRQVDDASYSHPHTTATTTSSLSSPPRAAAPPSASTSISSSSSLIIRGPDGQTKIKVDIVASDSVHDIICRAAFKLGIGAHAASAFLGLAKAANENSVLGAVLIFFDKNQSVFDAELYSAGAGGGAASSSSSPPRLRVPNLFLRFKHYKRHRHFNDRALQEQFYKQIHSNVISGMWPVSERLAVALAGLELQVLFGDATGKKRHSYFDKVGIDAYLPATAINGASAASAAAMTLEYWQNRLFRVHERCGELSDAAQTRARYIASVAASCPMWGLTFFDIRDRENRPFLAGIGEDGFFLFTADKSELLRAMSFDQLLGWDKSTTGIFVKKRGDQKMTLFASSKLQSQEMVDLLNEYYTMLPRDVQERLPIQLSSSSSSSLTADELRAALPDAALFEAPVTRRRPVSFSSRLECVKAAYLEATSQPRADGSMPPPNMNFVTAMDEALDTGANFEKVVLGSDGGAGDAELALIIECLVAVVETAVPEDVNQWRENVDIRSLDVSQPRDAARLSDFSVPNLCTFIRKFARLHTINLSGVPLENRNEGDVAAALRCCSELETLVLRRCRIGARGFAALLEFFNVAASTRLRVLDLEQNSLTSTCVTSLCTNVLSHTNRVASLTSLNVGFNLIDVPGLEALVATLRRGGSPLTTLDMSSNPGGRSAPARFADLVAAATGLTDVNASSNGLTGESALLLMSALGRQNSQIRKLNLSDNPIGPTLTRQRGGGGGGGVSSGTDADRPALFFAPLQENSSAVLNTLILDRCDLHEDAGAALAGAIQNNTRLVELILSNNRLASVRTGLLPGAWTDAIMNNNYLLKLDLTYNGISYNGLMRAFAALTRNRALTELRLDGNPLDRYPPNAAHSELVAFLEHNNSIRTLSLTDCAIRDDVLTKMGDGLARNRSLRRLEAGNNEITARGVAEFALGLQENFNLQFIDLSCRSVQIQDSLYSEAYRLLIERTNVDEIVL